MHTRTARSPSPPTAHSFSFLSPGSNGWARPRVSIWFQSTLNKDKGAKEDFPLSTSRQHNTHTAHTPGPDRRHTHSCSSNQQQARETTTNSIKQTRGTIFHALHVGKVQPVLGSPFEPWRPGECQRSLRRSSDDSSESRQEWRPRTHGATLIRAPYISEPGTTT